MPVRKAKAALPPLPTKLFTLLGPWRVREVKDIDPPGKADTETTAVGKCDYVKREVLIDMDFQMINRWQIFGHEAAHVWLSDGSLDTALSETQHEMVCDAFGTWFAAAISAGYITVNDACA